MDNHEHVKHFLDALSIASVVGTVMGAIPTIAALMSIIWSVIRICETKTVQRLLNRWR